MEEAKEVLKNIGKKIAKKVIYFLFPNILVVSIIIILLAASVYFITIEDGTYKEDDWSSVPYVAGYYRNGVTVNDDGSLSNGMSAQELWDKMLENGSRVDKYLDSPEELARLMRAEIVTQYPDTRSNPDEDINWDEIIESDALQGIIKFKRANSDGNISTMSYVDPETFQGYINEYNSSGSETAKKNALTHFTLKKSSSSTTTGNEVNAVAAGEGVMTDISQDIIDAINTTPWPGVNWCLKWVSDVYENAGVSITRYSTAYLASQNNVISMDKSAIPIGATVYGTGSNSGGAGHVGIYIGDGKVVDSVSSGIKTWDSIDSWLSWQTDVIDGKQGWLGWGWGDGSRTRGTTEDPNVTQNKASKNNTSTNNTNKQVTQTAVVKQVSGDGYSEEYTSSAGITYKHYKQYTGSYVENAYWSGTIHNSGCGPTSVAILASGLTNLDYTPANVAAEMNSNYGYTGSGSLKGEMDSLGMTSEIIDSPSADDIKNNLLNGKVMLVSVDSRTIFTNESHIMAIVDINSDGQVYICNPGSPNLCGWYDVSEITKGCNYIVVANVGAAGIASSTNSSSYTAVVATWKQVDTTVTTNDPNVQAKSETQYTMTTTTINYEGMVEPYTMPFDYLWAFLVEGEDKDFIFELADLVYGSDIQITVYDNLTVDTNVDDWHYKQRTKAVVDATITATCNGVSKTGSINNDEHDPHSETDYQTTKTVVTQTNNISAVLTRANVWYEDYKNDYTYVTPTETSTNNTFTKPDENYQSSPNSTGSSYSCEHINSLRNRLTSSVKSKAQQNDEQTVDPDQPTTSKNYTVNTSERINVRYYSKYVGITDNITNTVKTQKYTKGTPTTKEKTDKNASESNFVTIFNKSEYSKNKSNILNTTSWLFEILEINESTSDMVDLTKYLLYKATGADFGVTEFDFEEYDTSRMKSISNGTISGGTVEEKVWNYLKSAGFSDESAAGIMGNFYVESYMDPTFNGGAAAGIACFEKGAGVFDKLCAYANSKGKDWTDLQCQLDFLMSELESTFNTYTGMPRHYYGTGEWCWWPTVVTVEDYKANTNLEEATEIFCRVYEKPSITHLDRRIIYAHDYYNKYQGKSFIGGGSIIENAERIHSYMEQNNYFYCLDGRLRETFEESKSSKGVCCATFVAWVLRDAGLINQTSHSALGLASLLENTYHWTRVNGSDLQAGDAMVYNYGHIEIYAGNGKIYNAGSDNAIRSAAPSNQWMTPDYGLRAP